MSTTAPEELAATGGDMTAAGNDSSVAGAAESSGTADSQQLGANATNVTPAADSDSDLDQITVLNARRLSAEKAESKMRRIAEAEREKNSELTDELNAKEIELNQLRDQLFAASIPACTVAEHADLSERLATALEALEKAHRTIAERDEELAGEKARDYCSEMWVRA